MERCSEVFSDRKVLRSSHWILASWSSFDTSSFVSDKTIGKTWRKYWKMKWYSQSLLVGRAQRGFGKLFQISTSPVQHMEPKPRTPAHAALETHGTTQRSRHRLLRGKHNRVHTQCLNHSTACTYPHPTPLTQEKLQLLHGIQAWF